jgi:hypothetical protein
MRSSLISLPLYVAERGNTNKFQWMAVGRRYEISFEQFARLLGCEQHDANHIKIHFGLRLDASKMRFMYPSNKRGSVGTTLDLLPFYAYLNHLFQRMLTPREGDSSNIPSFNQNLLVAMGPRPHGYEFSVFYFICGGSRQYHRALLRVVDMRPTLCI